MNIIDKVNQSSSFYEHGYIGIDYKMAAFNYQSLKPFFKGKVALEIGPAAGFMTQFLINDFEKITVVEPSTDLLNKIPDRGNLYKHNCLIEDFHPDQKYDTIIMCHVLEHIYDPVSVLKKLRTLMHESSMLLISVPNSKSLHRLASVKMGLLVSEYALNQRDHELGHYRVYDRELLNSHIHSAGFEIVENGGIFLKPLSNAQIESSWNESMIDAFYQISNQFSDYCAEIFSVCKIKS